MAAASALGINPDPDIGGIGPSEVPPGVIHIVFPGSRKLKPGIAKSHHPRTLDTAQSVNLRAQALLNAFIKKGGAT
jgi:hypothetical protein